ncbi:PTS system mannose/fructose/sorbose family transporter subunit IID [Clostridiales bacterium COT073_COT-073]|nr:PTS system mannose/fructose/sorbose family transporter subunit IID [Clostridiales bacterium COT073_COT-073]
MSSINKAAGELTPKEKKLINSLFLNSFLLEACYNYERQQALGFAVGIYPAIEEFYKDEKDRADALERHMAIYNTTPHVSSTISGIVASLEKEASENKAFDTSIINNIKVSLMGPFAGIGDSIFWGTLRIIAAGIGISLAQQGSIMGPVLFLVLFNIPHLIVRYYGTVIGYKMGTQVLSNLSGSSMLNKISRAAAIVGLIVIGAMSASMVKLKLAPVFVVGETEFQIQNYIDQIYPLLLSLLYTLAMLGLLKKGYKSSVILIITLVIGVVGSIIGLF